MFTTVKALRASSAQQNRVTLVDSFMKRNYPGFNETTLIPLFMIYISNTEADMEWVASTNSVIVNLPDVSIALAKIKVKLRGIMEGNGTKETKRRALTEEYVRAWRASGRKDEFATASGAEYAWFIKELPTVGVSATDIPHDVAGAEAIATAPAVSGPVTGRVSSTVATMSAPPKTGKVYDALPSEKKEKVAPVKKAAPVNAAPVAKAIAPTAPIVNDNKGKPLAKVVLTRIADLNACATSKEKRAKILEGLGVPFSEILTALAQQGKLMPAQANEFIRLFK